MSVSVDHPIGSAVCVRLPDGSERIGRVYGHEPGSGLGPRFGGPFAGLAYHVRLEGIDGGAGRELIVGEAAVSGLVEDQRA